MSAITIVKEIKAVHPEYVALTKRGGFYSAYGKDAIIIAGLFSYKVVEKENMPTCSFPTKSLSKVIARLEREKINYLLVDSSDNFRIDSKENYKNLNNYTKQYKKVHENVRNAMRIDKINEFLSKNASSKEIKNIITRIEEMIYAERKF